MLDVAYHTVILVYLSAGWGYWLWLVTGRQKLFRHLWWLWCSLGGFCLQAQLVQECFYAGINLRLAVRLIALLAGGGCLGWLLTASRVAKTQRQFFTRQAVTLFITGAVVYLGQGLSLFGRGPSHYFGRAHMDQLNYVLLAQYLADEPPGITFGEVGLHPWMVESISIRDQRITQSIVHSELIVLSGQDAQTTYGALTLFYIVTLGVTSTALLLAWKSPWQIALLGGIWAGVLPAVTKVHLDGFLSQTATLWVSVAIAGVLARNPLGVAHAVVSGILLAFFMGAYPEYSFLGAGAVAWGILLITPRRRWLLFLGAAFSTAMACNLAYLTKFAACLFFQLSNVANPSWLVGFAPESGTFADWARDFTGEPHWPHALLTIIGVASCLLVTGILVSSGRIRRGRFLVLLATPATATLLLMLNFSAYAFAKLLMSSTPAVVAVITAGAFAFSSRINRMTAILAASAGLLISFGWLYTAHKSVLAGTEANIQMADLPQLRGQLSVINSSKDKAPVIVDTENPLTAAWLVYYLRNRDIYLARQDVGGTVMPSEYWDCRQIPESLHNIMVVSQNQVTRRDSIEPYPSLTSPDAMEQNSGGPRTWTANGHCTVKILRDKSSEGALYEWFCFKALPTTPGKDLSLWISSGLKKTRISAGNRWALLLEMPTRETSLRFENVENTASFTLVPLGFEPVGRTLTKSPLFYTPVVLAEAPR